MISSVLRVGSRYLRSTGARPRRERRWVLPVLLALTMARPAAAQINVDQLSMVFRLVPGEPRLGIINVRNDGPTPVQAVVSLADWDRDDRGTNRFFPSGAVSGSCGSALQVFPPTVSLDAGASQALRITIDSTVRLDAECWSAVLVERQTPPNEERTGVSYRMRTATKVYVEPPGLPLSAELTSIRVGDMAIARDTIRAIEVVMRNSGRRHLEGSVAVQVRSPEGTTVRTIELPRAYTLGGATLLLRAPFPPLPAGRYVLLALLDYGGAEIAAAQLEYVER